MEKLTQLVYLIADHWLYARRSSGGMTYAGFNLATIPVLQNSAILVSDSGIPLDPAETLETDAYKNALTMSTRHAPELAEPGLNFALGSIDVTKLATLQRIASLGLKHDNVLILASSLEAELKPQDIDRLEAQLGTRLINAKESKRFYT